MSERVTVVVPTRDNERTIEACLRAVVAQDYPDVELLVVDNHSTDRTAVIAADLADSVIVAGPERSAQRNAGITVASGEWILWLDSDMYLPVEAVRVAIETAHRTGVDAVALPECTIGEGFWTSCRALERECYLDQPELHNPRLLRRAEVVAWGGFDETMSGPEDTDLRMDLQALSRPIVLAPVLVVHDEGRLTLRTIFAKRVYYGRSIPALRQQHPEALTDQRRLLLKAYTQNWRRLAKHPVRTPCMIVMRAMEAVGYLHGARLARRETHR